MEAGTVPTLRNKSSTYHSGLVPRICVRVYRVTDTMFPPFVDLKYIWLLDVGKPILNSEEFLLLPSLESLKPLCSLIYGPTLSWLICLSPFSIYLQLSHSLFLLVFFLSYLSRALPILLSVFESLTLYHTYYLLECSYDSAVRQFYCTGKGGWTSYVETYQAWRVRFFDRRSSFYLYPGTLPKKPWLPGQICKCTQVHFFLAGKGGAIFASLLSAFICLQFFTELLQSFWFQMKRTLLSNQKNPKSASWQELLQLCPRGGTEKNKVPIFI